MKCAEARTLLDVVHDGESVHSGPLHEHLDKCSTCAAELAALRRLSTLLAVPVEEPDPSFLVRFRQRRDELRGSAAAWRWLAVRLVPLSVAAALGAAVAVLAARPAPGELRDLEAQALRSGVASVTAQSLVADRVLGLDLESLPASEQSE